MPNSRPGFEFTHDRIVDAAHILIKGHNIIRRISQTPGASQIMEIAAACFAGENIIHDGLAQAQQIARVPA